MSVKASADRFGLVGTVLAGQYRIDEVVGEGGFGVVYRALHRGLDQPVAVKALKGLDAADAVINETILQKFREEARLLYTLSQASLNVVRSLNFGATTTPSGVWTPYMVLEWLEGRSLAEDLEQRRQRGMKGRILEEALAILEPAASGLAAAHERNVVHRDIKPGNIFLVNDASRVKILDFGVAKIMKEGEEAGTKGTFTSFTWLYATPEQLEPRYGRTSLATDVYAFALLVTELLTDRAPVEARDPVAILKAATDPTTRPTPRTRGATNVPDFIEAACRRALAVDPNARFPSIKEFWAALAQPQVRASSPAITHTGPMPVKPTTPRDGAHAAQPNPTTVVRSGPPPGMPPPRSSHPVRTPHPMPVPPGLSPPMGTPPPGAFTTTGPVTGTGPHPQQPQRIAPPSGGATLVIVTVIIFVVASLLATMCMLSGKS